MYATTLFVSALERMKLGIFSWFECKNTFKDNSVVEGRLAMSSNLGPRATLGGIPAPTSWQLRHIAVATRRPGDVLLSKDWPNTEPCPTNATMATVNVSKRADELDCGIKAVRASYLNLFRIGSLHRAPHRILVALIRRVGENMLPRGRMARWIWGANLMAMANSLP